MHLDEEQIQRLLRGELSAAAERAARNHQAACPDCQRLLAGEQRADDESQALLRLVDHPAPPVTAGMIAARAQSRAPVWGRRAAAAVLLLGLAGTAYAIPGSPLRGWLKAAAQRMTRRQDHAPAAPGALPAPAPDVAGIAVAPGRQLIINFTSPQAVGQARVTLTDDAVVSVRAPSGAATYSSGVDRLAIDNRGATADFEIQIPRSARRVEIRVRGIRLLLKEGARVTTRTTADAPGRWLLPLTS